MSVGKTTLSERDYDRIIMEMLDKKELVITPYGNCKMEKEKGYYKITSNCRMYHMSRFHRVFYQDYYGVTLLPNVSIHHINGIKNDNRIENLQAINTGEHHCIHKTEQWKDPNFRKTFKEKVSGKNHWSYGLSHEEMPLTGRKLPHEQIEKIREVKTSNYVMVNRNHRKKQSDQFRIYYKGIEKTRVEWVMLFQFLKIIKIKVSKFIILMRLNP